MALMMVNSVQVEPGELRTFTNGVSELAAKANEIDDPFRWTAHQVLFGNSQAIHFAYAAEDHASLAALGTIDELWVRVLGSEAGERGFQQVNACVRSVEHTVSLDRPDLSYPPPESDRSERPIAVVTRVQVRPGGEDACEELIRKLAEAIPKVGDPTRIVTYQMLIGEGRSYWTVRPVTGLAELDDQFPPPELLNQAFGASEGGLIWRSGNEAVAAIEREIVTYRPELSNPGS